MRTRIVHEVTYDDGWQQTFYEKARETPRRGASLGWVRVARFPGWTRRTWTEEVP